MEKRDSGGADKPKRDAGWGEVDELFDSLDAETEFDGPPCLAQLEALPCLALRDVWLEFILAVTNRADYKQGGREEQERARELVAAPLFQRASRVLNNSRTVFRVGLKIPLTVGVCVGAFHACGHCYTRGASTACGGALLAGRMVARRCLSLFARMSGGRRTLRTLVGATMRLGAGSVTLRGKLEGTEESGGGDKKSLYDVLTSHDMVVLLADFISSERDNRLPEAVCCLAVSALREMKQSQRSCSSFRIGDLVEFVADESECRGHIVDLEAGACSVGVFSIDGAPCSVPGRRFSVPVTDLVRAGPPLLQGLVQQARESLKLLREIEARTVKEAQPTMEEIEIRTMEGGGLRRGKRPEGRSRPSRGKRLSVSPSRPRNLLSGSVSPPRRISSTSRKAGPLSSAGASISAGTQKSSGVGTDLDPAKGVATKKGGGTRQFLEWSSKCLGLPFEVVDNAGRPTKQSDEEDVQFAMARLRLHLPADATTIAEIEEYGRAAVMRRIIQLCDGELEA